MARRWVTAILAVLALIAGPEIIGSLPRHPAAVRVTGHTLDRCWQIMALTDQSRDVERAKEFCRPILNQQVTQRFPPGR